MVAVAQNYLQKHFSGLSDISDAAVQRNLWQQMQSKNANSEDAYLAEICLRCYISHQVYQVCLDLGMKFGSLNGFDYKDLLPFVLDDEVLAMVQRNSRRTQANSYQSLATTVLQTFDPVRGSLNTWVNRYVKQQPELKRFLLQHGVFLVSDWALLNDTNSKEMCRILRDMYGLTALEIEQTCDLLVSYHAVYREERLQQRLHGSTLPCQAPTSEQLTRIAKHLQGATGRVLSGDAILRQLQAIAAKLRRYRIAAQGGSVSSVSLDRPEIQPLVESSVSTQEDGEEVEFLRLYQKQFLASLDEAIAVVVEDFIIRLQRKRQSVEESFVTALQLFHCQGRSMNQIAPQIGLKKQYEVTRFLKLNELRADIRQKLLIILRSQVLEIAKSFTDSQSLQNLEQQVDVILDEQISSIMEEAQSEVRNPVRDQPLKGMLSRRLCHYLDLRASRHKFSS
ncbi:hypothetical protein NIES4101_52780 [Calothrix sp. NIES-4101]|nr:hypothetical protein NIES4101_52780 [Calothrix sp. NIES-4101]